MSSPKLNVLALPAARQERISDAAMPVPKGLSRVRAGDAAPQTQSLLTEPQAGALLQESSAEYEKIGRRDAATAIFNISFNFCELPPFAGSRRHRSCFGGELRPGFGRCGHIASLTILVCGRGKANPGR